MSHLINLQKVRSEMIMRSMQEYPCTLRIASFVGRPCSHQTTVVGCHLPITWGKGMSTKVTDLAVAAGCKHCHDILDGVDSNDFDQIVANYPLAFAIRLITALTETHALLFADEVINVPDAKVL